MTVQSATETVAMKRCSHCGYDMLADGKHFYRHKLTRDGFDTICIECRKKANAQHDAKRRAKRRCVKCHEEKAADEFDRGKQKCKTCRSEQKLRIPRQRGGYTTTAALNADAESPELIAELMASPTSKGDILPHVSREAGNKISRTLAYGPAAEEKIEPSRCGRHARLLPCPLCALYGKPPCDA